MKKIAIAFSVCAIVSVVQIVKAEDVKSIDLNAPFSDARVGFAWGLNGERIMTAHVPIIYKIGPKSGREYATLNFGVSNKNEAINKVGYIVSIGFRLDMILAKSSESEFSKKHLRFALLPPIQITPLFITNDFKKFIPMIAAVTKFGGK